MESVASVVYGHYYLPAPQSYASIQFPTTTFPYGTSEYCYPTAEICRPHSRGSSMESYTSPSTWPTKTALAPRKGCHAPFDMDTLKATIQAARAGSGEVYDAILSCTFKPRERAFTRLINMCGRQKESQKALEVFATMLECRGVRPNTYTYSALISACGNAGDWDAAVDVFRRMKKAAVSDPGCRPNQVTYNAIIAASERGGHYEVCISCFQELVKSGTTPDGVAYCSAINACQKIGDWEEAENVLADMHSHELVAAVGVYASMIDHYASNCQWKAALDLFLTMQVLGQSVDRRCCHGLMMALAACHQADMAYQLIQAMWMNDMSIDMPIYVTALHVMASAAMWEQTLEVVSTVDREGLVLPMDCGASLIKSMKSAGEEDLACRLEGIIERPNDAGQMRKIIASRNSL